MAGLNTNDIVEFKLRGRLFGQRTLNIFHYRVGDPSSATTYWEAIQAVTDPFDAGVESPTLAMLAVQTGDFTLEDVTGQRIYPSRDRMYISTSGLPGTYVGTCTAPNQAATIEKFSTTGGRHGIGSVHIPGVPTEAQVAGIWTPAYIALLNTVGNRMKLIYEPPLAGANMRPIILNRASKPLSYPLEGHTTQSTVRVMRRRTVGVGE